MKTLLTLASLLAFSTQGFANLSLLEQKKPIICYAEDNQSFTLSADRKEISYEVEGEGLGPEPVQPEDSSKGTRFRSFSTSQVRLSFGELEDSVSLVGDENPQAVRCQLLD